MNALPSSIYFIRLRARSLLKEEGSWARFRGLVFQKLTNSGHKINMYWVGGEKGCNEWFPNLKFCYFQIIQRKVLLIMYSLPLGHFPVSFSTVKLSTFSHWSFKPAECFISLRGSKTEKAKQSKARLRGLTKQALVKLSSSVAYLKAFFFLGKLKSAADLLSFPGGECVLLAVFRLLDFCQCFAQSGMPFDPMSDCPGPIHLSKPWAVQVPTSLWSLPSPSRPQLIYFETLLRVLQALKLSVCLFVWLDSVFLRAPVSGRFMLVSFLVTVFNNFGGRELNRISHRAVPLCIVANLCLCLDWKCVPCPMENAKGNLDRMECYTSSDLAKMVEIIQAPVMSLSCFICKQILQTGGKPASHCSRF